MSTLGIVPWRIAGVEQGMMVCPLVPLGSDPEQLHHTLLHGDVLNMAQEMLLHLDVYLNLPGQNRPLPFSCRGTFGSECPRAWCWGGSTEAGWDCW